MQSGKYERLQAVIIVSEAPAERENRARELAAALICEDPMHGPCGHCRHCKKSFVGVHPDIITVVRGKDEKGNVRREIVDRRRHPVSGYPCGR